MEDLIGEEGRARHVARVLKDRYAEEEDDDERDEGEDAAHAVDDAVEHQGLEEPRRDGCLSGGGEQREEAFKEASGVSAQNEGEFEDAPDDEEENGQADDLVHQDLVDRLRRRGMSDGLFPDRLHEGAPDVAVALFGDDDLGILAIVF